MLKFFGRFPVSVRRNGLFTGGLLAACVLLWAGCPAVAQPTATRPADLERHIDSLLASMSLNEKLGQLTLQWGGEPLDVNPGIRKQKLDDLLGQIRAGMVGALLGVQGAAFSNQLQRVAVEESPHGIPLLIGNDVIHGYRTIFPIPLAEAASWDPNLAMQTARAAAAEARAAGTHWTFAPMVDIARDPRWGRIAEGAGEDPFLAAAFAAARVRGFQGRRLSDPDALLACAKHFVAYGAAEGGRDYNTVDLSLPTLREVYLPPFEAAVQAGAGSIMTAFNEINGIPATACRLTLRRILRQEWGFRGFVVSDWTSITEMVVHGYARDNAEAAVLALRAGVDMDMSSLAYRTHLSEALQTGRVSQEMIDAAVRRVLRAKLALGLFERPYADPRRQQQIVLSDAHRALARKAAIRSFVLLRNEGHLLPLKASYRHLAVIGPLADSTESLLGTWPGFGRAEDAVSVLAGLRRYAKATGLKITHAPGCRVTGTSREGFDEALRLARGADLVVLVVGESAELSGEGHCRSSLDLPGVQRELAQAVVETGKPVVAVVMAGRPLSISWLAEHVPAILYIWHPGIEGGNAVADILFGEAEPGGRLPVSVPRTVGQVPVYYNHKNTGRPPGNDRYTSRYLDLDPGPLYPFGFGLSYTQFAFENLTIEPARIGPWGQARVSVDVVNRGSRRGATVVQLYIRDRVASRTRPVRELKGFRRVELEPGQRRRVGFTLSGAQLGFYDRHLEFVVEPGAFDIWVGPDSTRGLHGELHVTDPRAGQAPGASGS